MSLRSIITGTPENEIPYYPFPNNPKLIKFDGGFAYEYLSEKQINRVIRDLAAKIDFKQFDAVIVNREGGLPIYEDIAAINQYNGVPTLVEYHRPDNGIGSNITVPVPNELLGKKCLLFDDIADRKTTFKSMLENLSKESLCVSLTTKRGVPNQEHINNIFIGVELDNVWLAGKGMNIDYTGDPFYSKDAFRYYPGIVARPSDEVLKGLQSSR